MLQIRSIQGYGERSAYIMLKEKYLSIMKHEYVPFRLQEPSLMLIVLSELFTYPNTFLRPVATGVRISEGALY